MTDKIRRGGRQTRGGFLFELSGGDLSLDFINTVDDRPAEHPEELLSSPKDLFSWARQAGILTRREEQELQKSAARQKAEANHALKRALETRECMFRVFSALAEGESIDEELLNRWNAQVRAASKRYELRRGNGKFVWRLCSGFDDFESVMWTVVHAAIQLLTSSSASRIRKCASEKCDWLFLDTSKRGNRRWCDMTVCGNRAKAQRFYRRSKKIKSRAS